MKKAISIFSGGLDCTVATSVFDGEYDIHAITFNYGQKAFTPELKASKRICEKMGWSHEVIDLPWLASISNSSLNTDEDIPENTVQEMENTIRHAKVVEDDDVSTRKVGVGTLVKVHDFEFDEDITYGIVGATEVNIAENKISNESPVGRGLIGHKKGDEFEIETPGGMCKYKIIEITKM